MTRSSLTLNAARAVAVVAVLLTQQVHSAFAAPASLNGIGGSDFRGRASSLRNLVSTDLMVVGPVESVNTKRGSIQVLGQDVRVSLGSANSYAVGSVVEIRGHLSPAGFVVATSVVHVANRFVPGATNVFVRGYVRLLKPNFGIASVGRLSIDYTATLHSFDASQLFVGSVILATGIQPLAGRQVLASGAVSLDDGMHTNGIGGSDIGGIGGSDTNGIGGSDLNGIGGSDVNGIGGSDLNGIGGSDVNGIGGSDLSGIGGSDVNGIGGSDFRN